MGCYWIVATEFWRGKAARHWFWGTEGGTLLGSLNYDLYEMPPAGKFPQEVIADFRAWIEMGAIDPREGKVVAASEIDIEAGREFWALSTDRQT